MRFNKKILTIFFIALFAIVLVACDGEETTLPTTEIPTTEQPTTEQPTTEEPVDLDAILDSLRDEYADTLDDEDFVATENLNLITEIGGITIVWSSNNTEVLANDGTVTRPSFTEGEQTVILTATISHGSDQRQVFFFVTVSALDKTDAERAAEAFEIPFAFPSKELWTAADTLSFLTSGTDNDGVNYTIVWESSHPSIISATTGIITQPLEENVRVTMTATIEIEDVEYTRSIDFMVAKVFEAPAFDTIQEIADQGVNSYTTVRAVTVISVHSQGFFITDGVDILYVYGNLANVEAGKVYDVTGHLSAYFGYLQYAANRNQPEKPLMAVEVAGELRMPTATPSTIADVMVNSTAEGTDRFLYGLYEVTGRIYSSPDYTYKLFIVPSDYDFDANYDPAQKPVGDHIEIYAPSFWQILVPFHGQEVTIPIVPNGYHTGHDSHYAWFLGTALDVNVTIEDDQVAVNTALGALSFPTQILENTTLTFPETLYGVALTYEVTDNVINLETGFVNAESLTEQITVTLTINAARGDKTGTRTIEINVGELTSSNIEDALAGEKDELFKIRGIIVASDGRGTHFIIDETGAIALYANNADDLALIANNIGNRVEIIGTRDTFNGLNQLRVQSIEEVEEGTLPNVVNLDEIELNAENLLEYQAYMVELNGMLVKTLAVDSDGNITLTLENMDNETTLNARWDRRVTLSPALETALKSIKEGDLINITGVLGWFNNPQMVITNQTLIELLVITDEMKIEVDKASLNFGGNLYYDFDVTLPDTGVNGSAIAWEILVDADDYATLVDGTLTIVRPTADAVVTIKATLTLGDAEETAEFTYNLIAKDIITDFTLLTDSTEDAFDIANGELVMIQGVVVQKVFDGVFVQDENGIGFFLFRPAGADTLEIGDEVLFLGTMGSFNGARQLTSTPTILDVVSQDNAIIVTTVTEAEMAAFDITNAGTYMSYAGFEFLGFVEGDTRDLILGFDGGQVVARFYASWMPWFTTQFEVGDILPELHFVLYNFRDDENQIDAISMPAYDEALEAFEATLAAAVAYEYADYSYLMYNSIVEDFEVEVHYLLSALLAYNEDPMTGVMHDMARFFGALYRVEMSAASLWYDDVEYTWSTELTLLGSNWVQADDTTLVSVIVADFNADKIVNNTVVVTIQDGNGFVQNITFIFDVEDDMQPTAPTTVTGAYPAGSGTTNMTADNNAETIGLDADIFTVTSIERVVSLLHIGLNNAGQIRLYSSASDPEGNILEISIAEGLIITNVQIVFASTVVDALIMMGDDDVHNGALVASETMTFADLDINKFSVKNINGSGQIWISQIIITYQSEDYVAVEKETFTETFETNIGTGYTDGTFTGVNDIVWTYVHARDEEDFAIDGTGIMLRRATEPSSLEATFEDGIDSISFEYRKAFTGGLPRTYKVDITVDGVTTTHDIPEFGEGTGDDPTVHTFSLTDLDLTGEVTVKIYASGGTSNQQMVIDNFTWTTNPE